jgi:hypothetical protein
MSIAWDRILGTDEQACSNCHGTLKCQTCNGRGWLSQTDGADEPDSEPASEPAEIPTSVDNRSSGSSSTYRHSPGPGTSSSGDPEIPLLFLGFYFLYLLPAVSLFSLLVYQGGVALRFWNAIWCFVPVINWIPVFMIFRSNDNAAPAMMLASLGIWLLLSFGLWLLQLYLPRSPHKSDA